MRYCHFSVIRCLFILCLFSVHASAWGQESDAALPQDTSNTKKAHKLFLRQQKSKYLDDQLYIGFTYNILTGMPTEVKNYSFSNTLSLGYIRDIPLNERRNIGLGLGLGLGYHTYYTNLRMEKDETGLTHIRVMQDGEYQSNRFSLQTLDIPFQIRFRGSTADKFNFWRVYAGVTFSWVYKNSSTLKDEVMKVRYYNIPYLKEWLYAATLQVGYGKFTVKAEYTLGSLFSSKAGGVDIPVEGIDDMRSCNVGLLVYLL